MEFLRPVMLWSALAIVIPVIIHFWYQKKGKTIDWATTQWLIDKTSLQHRGLRLDEIPLLLIRCLLLLLFVLLLSKPIADWPEKDLTTKQIHLVEPDNQLVSNFRFELESALKNGEKVYWVGSEPLEVRDIENIPHRTNSELYLQKNVKKLSGSGKELNLYIRNNQQLAEMPRIYIPGSYRLFSIIDSTQNSPIPYLDLGNSKRLFVNKKSGEKGRLEVINVQGNNAKLFESAPVHKGKIHVLLDYKNVSEQQTVQAALLTLSEVYEVPFVIDLAKKPESKYNWIFTDQKIMAVDPEILYVVSGGFSDQIITENIIQIQDSLRLPTSELVQNGQLPEWLGNLLITNYKINKNKSPLSKQQLNAQFVQVKPSIKQNSEKLNQWLLLFFVITLLLERWIALSKTGSQAYG